MTTAEERINALLKAVGSKATCKGCAMPIYWVKTPGGKNMPVDPDGTVHWSTCPRALDFKTQQRKMF